MKKVFGILMLLFAFSLTLMPYNNQADFVDASISRESATEDVSVTLAREKIEKIMQIAPSRNPGSEGEKLLADNIAYIMNSIGYSVEVQNFHSETPHSFDSQNVIAKKDYGAEKSVILGSHIDAITSNGSYGANDNASGVAGALMLADTFSKYNDLPYNIIFAFYGAEEYGEIGSREFVKTLNAEDILLSITLDSIGGGDYLYYFTTDSPADYSNYLDNKITGIKKLGSSRLYSTEAYGDFAYSHIGLHSDNIGYLENGFNSILFFAGNLDRYSGLGFYESVGKDKLMHIQDTVIKNEEYFGNEFYRNIYKTTEQIKHFMLSEDFVLNMPLAGRSILTNLDFCKGITFLVLTLVFAGTIITILLINKRRKV